MTTTRQALGKIRDGNHVAAIPGGEDVGAWDPDAIGRMYDEAKANIADPAAAWADEDVTDPWPETEKIDVRAIQPPAASRASSPEPASPRALEAPAGPAAPEPPADAGRPRLAWRRWFSR